MRMFIELMNERVIERKLNHVAATRANMRQILEGPVADVIFSIEDQIFNSQGRRGGGSWAFDSPSWLKRKLANGLDPRIGHATLRLRRAMTIRNAPHQRFVATSQSLKIGTDLPYAESQQHHRPFIKFTPRDKQEIKEVISLELKAAWRRG